MDGRRAGCQTGRVTVHDLARHRARTGRRRWLFVVLAASAGALLVGLVAICMLVPGPSSAPPVSDVVAFPPRDACLPLVAHRGPAACPFAPRDPRAGSDWATAFEQGHECLDAGGLFLPTGEVVATDALVEPEHAPLAPRFAAGTTAEVWIARRDGDNTLAMLLVGRERPARFEHAGAGTAYGVDSGTGSFLDVTAARWLSRHVLAQPSLFDVMMGAGWETSSHLNLCIDGARGTNVVIFTSGAGDGVYDTHAGYDARGALVALVTDFGLDPIGTEGE